jgi:hypothetical protein
MTTDGTTTSSDDFAANWDSTKNLNEVYQQIQRKTNESLSSLLSSSLPQLVPLKETSKDYWKAIKQMASYDCLSKSLHLPYVEEANHDINAHAKISTLMSSDQNQENNHSFFSTLRQSYVAHVLGSELVQKSGLYILKIRSLFCTSVLLGYLTDIILAALRFEFTNQIHWKADYLLCSHMIFANISKMTLRCLFLYVHSCNIRSHVILISIQSLFIIPTLSILSTKKDACMQSL